MTNGGTLQWSRQPIPVVVVVPISIVVTIASRVVVRRPAAAVLPLLMSAAWAGADTDWVRGAGADGVRQRRRLAAVRNVAHARTTEVCSYPRTAAGLWIYRAPTSVHIRSHFK